MYRNVMENIISYLLDIVNSYKLDKSDKVWYNIKDILISGGLMYDVDEPVMQINALSSPSQIDDRDDYLSLLNAIRGLDKKDQIIIALVSSGFTRIESGVLVGITRNAVGKRYTKAIIKLKNMLAEV